MHPPLRPLVRLASVALVLSSVAMGLSLALGQPASQPASAPAEARPAKIVLLAGRPSHGAGTHAWEDDCRLIQRCLETASNLPRLRVEMHAQGWPKDAATLDDAAAIVLLSDGFQGHPFFTKAQPERMEVIRKQARRGCGIACVHFAVCPLGRGESELLEWIGGIYKDGYSQNPVNTVTVSPAGQHPICRGWKPFTTQDEFYYRIWFGGDKPTAAVPIATAPLPPRQPKAETIAWAIQRPDGGRGFGFTGGHWSKNLLLEDYRRMLLNAIVWTAGLDVPAEGVKSTVEAAR